MDGPGESHIKQNKPDKDKHYMTPLICGRKTNTWTKRTDEWLLGRMGWVKGVKGHICMEMD